MFAAIRFVRDHCRLDPIANQVAMAIASFGRPAGDVPVSFRQLAAVTGRHTKTIELAIARLEDAGIVAVERSATRMNRYRFPVVDAVELSTAVTPRSAQLRGANARQLRARAGATARARRAHLDDEQLKEQRAYAEQREALGDIFMPGSGWIPNHRAGAVNE